jgi:hypothetical protein
MKELLDALNTDFDDAEGWIRIVGADWFEDDLSLNLVIQFHDDRAAELWEVSCEGVIEESLCSKGTGTLSVSADSPLLKPFVEPTVSIMFAQNLMAPEALFGIVSSCCLEITGRAESIPRFMNGAPATTGIASSQYGLLGKFPESVAKRILDALQDKPITAHVLPAWHPQRWTGSEYVPYQHLQALEIGASYVIAQQFKASRV